MPAAEPLLRDPSLLEAVWRAETRLPFTAPEAIPDLLADVPLDLFATIALYRPDHLPNLSAWLPAMPQESVQLNSVGTIGEQAMREAAFFVRALVDRYERDGRRIKDARVLDYGICWARLSRLLYKYVPTSQLYGVDAWASSLDHARALNFKGELALIEAAPQRLPFDEKFDVVFAFSVFTHLAEDVARAAVKAIRASMTEGGLLAITIRPAAYYAWLPEGGDDHRAQVEAKGFGFTPYAWSAKPGKGGYGNTTVTVDYVRRNWTEFQVLGTEFNAADPHQLYLYLQAGGAPVRKPSRSADLGFRALNAGRRATRRLPLKGSSGRSEP